MKLKIGDKVIIDYPDTLYHERKGKIVGKRGDHAEGDPYYTVFVY